MSLKEWSVRRVSRNQVSDFIEANHYSGNINGCASDFCYALYDTSKTMVGAMFFGAMAMVNQWKPYAGKESDVIELRRLCCIDNTPKNTESYFIGFALRLLRRDWDGKVVVSYADKEYGHNGTIYKASNFKMVGESPGAKIIIYKGKRYHDKTIRTKHKGEIKPYAKKITQAIESGDAIYKKTKGKYIYVFTLPKKKRGSEPNFIHGHINQELLFE